MSKKTSVSLTKRFQPFVEGQPFFHTIKTEAGVILKKLDIHIRGTITFAGGTTSGTSQGENPGGLLQTVTVDAEPISGGLYKGGRVVNLTPRAINKLRIFDLGYSLPDLLLGATGIVGAAQAYAFDTILSVFFSLPGNENPDDTALRLDQFSDVKLTLNLATIVSMLVGNDRTVTLSACAVDIYEDREYSPNFWPNATLYQDSKQIAITGASAEFSIDTQLPKDDAFLHALLITESTNKALVDTILNKATVFSGTEEIRTMYAYAIRAAQMEKCTDFATTMTGLYYLEIAKRGVLGNAMRKISLTLDVSNPGTDNVQIVSRRVQLRLADPPKAA